MPNNNPDRSPLPPDALALLEDPRLEGQVAVCVLTGSGLKDPDTALTIEAVRHETGPTAEAVERALGLG